MLNQLKTKLKLIYIIKTNNKIFFYEIQKYILNLPIFFFAKTKKTVHYFRHKKSIMSYPKCQN